MKQITPEELKHFLDQGNLPTLLDVRENWEFEICHIDKSINISMSMIPSRVAELDPEMDIVVICHHGVRSYQVASYLEAEGFTNISNLAGGIDAWAKTVEPVMAQY